MTDPFVPGGAGQPDAQLNSADAGQPGPRAEGGSAGSAAASGATPDPGTIPNGGQPARRPAGRKGALIAIGILVVPLAVILYAVKDNAAADDLKVGDCFDVPTATTVQTVQHHPCTEAHGAEVIGVAEYTEGGTTYPISFVLEPFVTATCVPAFQAYVGADVDAVPDLSIGYFYPSRDSWSSGDRTITCYVARTDDGQMTESVKGSAAP
jgi:hypothetical protein